MCPQKFDNFHEKMHFRTFVWRKETGEWINFDGIFSLICLKNRISMNVQKEKFFETRCMTPTLESRNPTDSAHGNLIQIAKLGTGGIESLKSFYSGIQNNKPLSSINLLNMKCRIVAFSQGDSTGVDDTSDFLAVPSLWKMDGMIPVNSILNDIEVYFKHVFFCTLSKNTKLSLSM